MSEQVDELVRRVS